MFEWIVNKIINFLSMMIQGISWLLTFLANHLWALFSSVFAVVCSLWTAVSSTFSDWINKFLAPVTVNGLEFGNSLGDCIDNAIIRNLGDASVLGTVVQDLFYAINLGGFFSSIVSYFIPVVLSVFVYRVIKSWIPTLAGA